MSKRRVRSTAAITSAFRRGSPGALALRRRGCRAHGQWPEVRERPALDQRQRDIERAVRQGPEPIRGASNADSYGLAAAHLECAVMLRVAEFRRAGGPTDFDRDAVRGFAQDICAFGDDVLYGGPRCAQTMDKIVEAIAVLSFQPGGCHVAGRRFESDPDTCPDQT